MSSIRNSLSDYDYKGENYFVNRELKEGPIKQRKCTDCLFIIVFALFFGMMIGITTFAYKNQQFDEFLAPIDAAGKLCGIDYPDYPYIYYTIQLIFPFSEKPTKE
jgi:hypothetical protein